MNPSSSSLLHWIRICGWKLTLVPPLTSCLMWSPYFLGAKRAAAHLRVSTRNRATLQFSCVAVSAISIHSLKNLSACASRAQRLRELGWIEDRTIKIDLRWAEGRNDLSAEIATDFVRLKVDVIVTYGSEHVQIAKEATSTIPIVALMGDPVGSGLVASLAHPGGNLTGLSAQNAISTANGSSFCMRSYPICGGWWSCSTATISPTGWNPISFGPQPFPSGW